MADIHGRSETESLLGSFSAQQAMLAHWPRDEGRLRGGGFAELFDEGLSTAASLSASGHRATQSNAALPLR
ncbi:MAG: hypothetical protein RL033_214 [Pseudomonadota bacterium]